MEVVTTSDDSGLSLFNLWKLQLKVTGSRAKKTNQDYLHYGRVFCKWMRGKQITPESVLDWMKWVVSSSGMNPPSINKMNSRVKSFLKFLHSCEYLRTDLSSLIFYQPENGPAPIQTFSEDDIDTLKRYVAKSTCFTPHLWLCILSYRTGLRLKDCCYLRKRDIYLNENGPSYIEVHPFKNRRHGASAICTVPLIPYTDVWDWIKRLWNCERYKRADGIDDFIHPDCPGLYECHWQSLSQDFTNLFLRSGIGRHKTFKHFRSSFASNLINSGAQVALVCKMTGHSNVKTLLKYLKPDIHSLQDGLAKSFQYAADASSGRSETSPLLLKEYRDDTES